MNTPTDNAWLDELMAEYRMGFVVEDKDMKEHSTKFKQAILTHIDTVCREAYRKGYNDNARDCYCDSPGATDGVITHHHLLDDGESHNIRPDLTQLNPNKDTV